MKDKLALSILACITVVLIMIAFMMIGTSVDDITGHGDERYVTLFISGTPITEISALKIAGLVFGLCTIIIFLCAVTIGVQKRYTKHQKVINRTVAIGAALYLGVYLWMVVSWWGYTETNSFDYVLGLPKPTAIQMFGLLFIPAFLSFFYITRFDTWVYSDEDEARFKEILKRRALKNRH